MKSEVTALTALAGCCLTSGSSDQPGSSGKDAIRKLDWKGSEKENCSDNVHCLDWVNEHEGAQNMLQRVQYYLGARDDREIRQRKRRSVGKTERETSLVSVSEWRNEAKRLLDVVPRGSLLDVASLEASVRIDLLCRL